mgnify:CR=1 FL=1
MDKRQVGGVAQALTAGRAALRAHLPHGERGGAVGPLELRGRGRLVAEGVCEEHLALPTEALLPLLHEMGYARTVGASVAACDSIWALKGPRFGWLSDSPARVREAEDKVRKLQQNAKETTGDHISRFHAVFDTAKNMGARVTHAEAVDLAIAGALMDPAVRFHLATAAVTRHRRDQDLRGITEDDADMRLQDLMTFTALPIAADAPTACPTTTPIMDRVEARDRGMEDTAAEMKAKRQAQDDQTALNIV